MGNSTKLPLAADLFIGLWSLKGAPAPKLAASIDEDDTIITVSTPLKDNTGTIVTGKFLMGIRKANGWTETIWVPAGAVSADGKTLGSVAKPVVRGIDPNGTDFTVGDAAFADEHEGDEPVFCVIAAVLPEMMRSAIQGLIATGGTDFIIGADAAGTITISRSTGVGTYAGFLRWFTTSGKAQFSNDGAAWTAFDDTVASVLVKTSAADTTPGYTEDKIKAGANITVTLKNAGGNEYLEIATTVGQGVAANLIYTPAYMTGGTSAETNIAVWDSVTDGSFRVTLDGVGINVDAIDLTSVVGGDMDDVALVLQTALRVVTSDLETIVWDTDHFIMTSADTSSSSEMSVLTTSSGTVGTDISGAGAGDYMDSDTGNGVATKPVLDPTEDGGKIGLLASTGFFDSLFARNADLVVAGEAINGTSTPQAVHASDGSNGRTAGSVYKSDADDFTNGANKFLGFITTNVADGETTRIEHTGVVGGFSGLTKGVKYRVGATAGGIVKTTANTDITVGTAISETQILIEDARPILQVTESTALSGGGPFAVAFTIGFRPIAIIATMGQTNANAYSLAVMNWAAGVSGGGTIGDDSDGAIATASFAIWTDNGAGTSAEYWTGAIGSVTDTGWTTTWTIQGAANSITANVKYTIFG